MHKRAWKHTHTSYLLATYQGQLESNPRAWGTKLGHMLDRMPVQVLALTLLTNLMMPIKLSTCERKLERKENRKTEGEHEKYRCAGGGGFPGGVRQCGPSLRHHPRTHTPTHTKIQTYTQMETRTRTHKYTHRHIHGGAAHAETCCTVEPPLHWPCWH